MCDLQFHEAEVPLAQGFAQQGLTDTLAAMRCGDIQISDIEPAFAAPRRRHRIAEQHANRRVNVQRDPDNQLGVRAKGFGAIDFGGQFRNKSGNRSFGELLNHAGDGRCIPGPALPDRNRGHSVSFPGEAGSRSTPSG